MGHCLKDTVKSISKHFRHQENASQISKIEIRCLLLKLAILFTNAVIFIDINMIKNDKKL
jgi:hypothetical protein